MNNFKDSFEQMDKEFEKIFTRHKEACVPAEFLKDFDVQVKRRILESNGQASPFGIGLGVFAISLAAAGLIAFLFSRSTVPAPQPAAAPEPVTAVSPSPSPLPLEEVGENKGEGVSLDVLNTEVSSIEESDLLTEIAALQELGIWTDADDESIGISAEQTLGELELALESENLPLQSGAQFPF